MTRAELEKEIVKKLWEIQDMVEAFDPSIDITSLSCSIGYVNAFALHQDENGEPKGDDPYFYVTEFRRAKR